jgi:gamma-glutamylcyclotransferase (GGCT)/AIG2-like uncharacterized protein YtfP
MAHKHGKKKLRRIERRDALKWLKGEAREEKQDKLYFGYGSNLHIGQMKRRCRDSVPVIAGSLPGKLLSFSNVLTIEPHESEAVVGGIYEVSKSDELALDRYEGHPRTYSKRHTHITLNGERRTVFYYVLNPPYTWCAPTEYYYAIVERGYHDWGLDVRLLKDSCKRAREAEKQARKLYFEEQLGSEDKLSWQSEPNQAYTVNADGTIDYLDFTSQLDKEWDAAIRRDEWLSQDLEEAFQSDYHKYAGW